VLILDSCGVTVTKLGGGGAGVLPEGVASPLPEQPVVIVMTAKMTAMQANL
jgi:hypothetical protein